MGNVPLNDRIRLTSNIALNSAERPEAKQSESRKENFHAFGNLLNKEIEHLCRVMQAYTQHRLLKVAMEDDSNGISIYRGILIENLKSALNLPPSKNQQIGQTSGSLSSDQSKKNIDYIIDQAAEIHQVDPLLIRAVIHAESGFRTDATSPKGAAGLMQLMPKTAKELGVENSYDPYENVMAGTRYLRTLIDRYGGNIDKALSAYNWGMGNMERNPGKMPRETRNYIVKVNQYYKKEQT